MTEGQTVEGQAQHKTIKLTLNKQMVPFEHGDPASGPLFINYAQVAHAGGSGYIDVGIISLDDIIAQSGEATFLVLNRLVMSMETLRGLRDQINKLLESGPSGDGTVTITS